MNKLQRLKKMQSHFNRQKKQFHISIHKDASQIKAIKRQERKMIPAFKKLTGLDTKHALRVADILGYRLKQIKDKKDGKK